jgi:hypothetical protein
MGEQNDDREMVHFIQAQEARRALWSMISVESSSMFESVIGYGQLSCKAAMLINGGASVAILAFLGQIFTRAEISGLKNLTQCLSQSLCLFVIGTALAALLTGMGYFTQRMYSTEMRTFNQVALKNFDSPPDQQEKLPTPKKGHVLTAVSVLIGLGSFGCFLAGAWIAKAAFVAQIARMGS